MKLKEVVRKHAYEVLSIVNKIIPKQKKIFIYGGNNLDDNSEAMLRFVSNYGRYPIVCLVAHRIQYQDLKNVTFVPYTVKSALKELLTSTVVLDSSTHKVKVRPTKDQCFIQMMHGSPLKHMPPNPDSLVKNGDYYSYCFYAAEIFKKELQDYLQISSNKMVLAGNPRNDYLFEHKALPDCFGFKGKRVIWMPTFRHGIGLSETEKDIPVIDKSNILLLDQELSKRDIKLYIKPHPVQVNSIEATLGEIKTNNISIITNNDLQKAGVSTYEFLGEMDALLTDYSSVFFDYLLLDRPIGFVIDDIKEYSGNRGFAFDDPFEVMPGKKIFDFSQLVDFFDELYRDNDSYKEQRQKVNSIVNYYKDGLNRDRCLKLFAKYLER